MGSPVSKVFVFALTAALNPTLLTASTVMLLLPKPKRLLLGYWLGAMTTGMVLGLTIVHWLKNSGAVNTTKHTVAPGIDIALGVLALVVAVVVGTGRWGEHRAKQKAKKGPGEKKVPKWQQTMSRGTARTTFVIGLLLSFPGASYLASLTEIERQNLSDVETVLTVLAVNLIMLMLLELPLISYTVAPEWTPKAIEGLKGWLSRNGARAIVVAFSLIGVAAHRARRDHRLGLSNRLPNGCPSARLLRPRRTAAAMGQTVRAAGARTAISTGCREGRPIHWSLARPAAARRAAARAARHRFYARVTQRAQDAYHPMTVG